MSIAEPEQELGDGAAAAARKRLVARSFGAAAETYDQHARVQQTVAAELARRAASLPLPAAPRVLEIGCGTGFLTALLRERWPAARLIVTDLAAPMVARCRTKLAATPAAASAATPHHVVMDGEWPALGRASHDLVVASLAVQWFAALGPALARLARCLTPGGSLLLATLGTDTFREWCATHDALGLRHGVPALPSVRTLADALPALGPKRACVPGAAAASAVVDEAWHALRYPSGRAFLEALRAAGAQVPAAGHVPLAAAEMRRVLHALEAGGEVQVTYHVLYAHWLRPGSPSAPKGP
ncbi:MAG: methyltransferase domain-containing protein [Proteobacteria bacterium]|nr:methyltransferase domain-containing protein [Pseudomonadota bacterium]